MTTACALPATPATPVVWVVGTLAWDDSVQIPRLPEAGRFMFADAFWAGPGGTGGNIAVALASAGLPTAMVAAVGVDAYADRLAAHLFDSGVDAYLTRVPGSSPRSLILVDADGDRSIIACGDDLLAHAVAPVHLWACGDIVVFPSWRPHLSGLLDAAESAGCRRVVGLRALADQRVTADLAIGSHHELGSVTDPFAHVDRFGTVVVTRGADGADVHSAAGSIHVAARPVTAVDATGAGDSFLAGFVSGWSTGRDVRDCAARGIAWGAAAVSALGSCPPPWSKVAPLLGE